MWGAHVPVEIRVPIYTEQDIVAARQLGRAVAEQAGFVGSQLTVIATAISELARNIVTYAVSGEITISLAEQTGRRGVLILARDQGPGIQDLALAMRDGYSTSNSLGMGLPGTRRLMDEFEIASVVGEGTTVTARMWRS
ncbi:MAG: serine/threonine-protein kinase RsbT [Chloroflexota bacterium]|nr:serine/threonine-protein kinase RsbT [Chloroflexota bacterium]